jgi:hypothetical protein
VGRERVGEDGGNDLTNVQYKLIWNCHNESPPVQQMYPNKNKFKSRLYPCMKIE